MSWYLKSTQLKLYIENCTCWFSANWATLRTEEIKVGYNDVVFWLFTFKWFSCAKQPFQAWADVCFYSAADIGEGQS